MLSEELDPFVMSQKARPGCIAAPDQSQLPTGRRVNVQALNKVWFGRSEATPEPEIISREILNINAQVEGSRSLEPDFVLFLRLQRRQNCTTSCCWN